MKNSRSELLSVLLCVTAMALTHTGCALPPSSLASQPGHANGTHLVRGTGNRANAGNPPRQTIQLGSEQRGATHLSDRFSNPLRGDDLSRTGPSASNIASPNSNDSRQSQTLSDSNVQLTSFQEEIIAEPLEQPVLADDTMELISGQEPMANDHMSFPPDSAKPIGVYRSVSDQPVSGQGHFERGAAVFGQILNTPAQPASARAVQLTEENRRLQSELQSQTRFAEELQSKLRQHESMWVQAQSDFQEVRRLVDQLNGENSVLNLQIAKLKEENSQLQSKYKDLFDSMEQTLDELLMKAIAQPRSQSVEPPAPVESPKVNAQQASSPQTK